MTTPSVHDFLGADYGECEEVKDIWVFEHLWIGMRPPSGAPFTRFVVNAVGGIWVWGPWCWVWTWKRDAIVRWMSALELVEMVIGAMDRHQTEGECLMACEFICDGCGTRAKATQAPLGTWLKPHEWYERSDDDGIQTACSRECIKKIAERSGKTSVVLPV